MSLPEIAPEMIVLGLKPLIVRTQSTNQDIAKPSAYVLDGPATRALERSRLLAFRKRMQLDHHEVRPTKLMRLSEPRSPILQHWNNIFNALPTADHDVCTEVFPLFGSNWDDDDAVEMCEDPTSTKFDAKRSSNELKDAEK
jgi:hypothetical protein